MADSMENFKLNINKEYAKKLHKQKEKSELDRLKQKYGDVDLANNEESSSSESEDDDARELTTQKEKDFLTVLSLIKRKDPKIYSKDTHFYHSEDESLSDGDKEKKKKKPMFLKDYERKELMEKGSKAFVSDEESEEEIPKMKIQKEPLTYYEEQKALKDSFKDALRTSDNEEEDFLKVRMKTEDEKQEEERAYVEWLKGEKDRLESAETRNMEALRRYWTDPNLDSDEKFLRDFILNKGYMDKDSDRIPTYDEIIGEEDADTEDKDEVEKQEQFERKYNFRFEEPDSELIKSYPRTVGGSVRRTDDRRKEKRKEREERKKEDKEKKREELKRLKNLKKKEIMEKLDKLKEITGNPHVGFSEEDLEGDFDASKYDQAMQKVFDEQYYGEEVDEEKPVFEDDLEDIDEEPNWDEWEVEQYNSEAQGFGTSSYEPHSEDPNFNMDADFEEEDHTKAPTGKKRKRMTRLAQALRKNKPTFDPNEKTFEEYFDEYYKLDYEDVIGDLPCRFKYRSVVPNDFGLTTEEILKCPDKELNQWVSLKRAVQYRPEAEEYRDVKKYRKKSRDYKHKTQILASLKEQESTRTATDEFQNRGTKTIKRKKGTSDNGTQERTATTKENTFINKETNREGSLLANNSDKPTSTKTQKKRSNWRRKLSSKELKEVVLKKRLAMRFRGANKKHVTKLSTGRLAAFGLERKRRKKK